ncbi:hypothetical protein GGR52DRAFT_565994 [Hypoxylon sp. FL1284]|nr:hypothetical protein GGR52DRAFT_565994 [Hypoxylon sp. FL1284]
MSSSGEEQPKRQQTATQETDNSDQMSEMSETSRPPRTRRRNRRRPGSVQPMQPQDDQNMLQQRQQQQMMQQQQQMMMQQQQPQQQGGGDGGKSDTLKLRLDLNLEVEVTLKARIHGDLTLALLYVVLLLVYRIPSVTNLSALPVTHKNRLLDGEAIRRLRYFNEPICLAWRRINWAARAEEDCVLNNARSLTYHIYDLFHPGPSSQLQVLDTSRCSISCTNSIFLCLIKTL